MAEFKNRLRLLTERMETGLQAAPVLVSSFARRLREEATIRHAKVDAAVIALLAGSIVGACTVPESSGVTFPITLAVAWGYGIHLHLRSHRQR